MFNIREWAAFWDDRNRTWTHNILIGQWQWEEKVKLFGFQDPPYFLPDERFIEMDIRTRWPEIMVQLGLFPSATQAKKNGWDKDIAEGWTQEKIFRDKKSKVHTIYIWKVTKRIPWQLVESEEFKFVPLLTWDKKPVDKP